MGYKNKSTKRKNSSYGESSWWRLIPIVLIIAVIPLIVKMYRFDPNLSQFSWASPNGETSDFFNYHKSVAITIVGIFMLIVVMYRIVTEKKKLPFTAAFYPLGVYALFVLISTICSEYSYFSYNGMDDHFETVFVLFSYCIITVYTFYHIKDETDIKRIMNAWVVSIALLVLLGLTQILKCDFFSTPIGSRMILPMENWNIADSLEFKFGKGTAYLTFFNPNYVGYFAVLALPVLITLCLFTKKLWLRIVYGVLAIGVMLCLFGAGAENGIVALIASFTVMIIGYRKKLIKYWPVTLGIVAIVAIVFIGYNVSHQNAITNALTKGLSFQKNEKGYALQKIVTGEDAVEIVYNKNTLILQSSIEEDGSLKVILKDQDDNLVSSESTYEVRSMQETGEDGQTVEKEYNIPVAVITDERFLNFKIYSQTVNNAKAFIVNINGRNWTFSNQTNKEGYYYYAPHGQYAKIIEAESAKFLEGYEKIVSGRGYIWSRSLPLLKENIFIGTGPDTFAIAFPQQDYVVAANSGFYGMIVTKPHNLYMQMGVQTGLISLIAFLVFYIIYAISSIKLYWKQSMDTLSAQLGVAILASTSGYMVSALVNDSTITIAPIYWCLIGIGLAINRILKQEKS